MDKTKIMIFTNDTKIKEKNIKIGKAEIGHTKIIKILGTKFNDQLNWQDHIDIGTNSLISQLKQKNAIKRIEQFVDKNCLLKYINAIFISKLNYHVKPWVTCLKH